MTLPSASSRDPDSLASRLHAWQAAVGTWGHATRETIAHHAAQLRHDADRARHHTLTELSVCAGQLAAARGDEPQVLGADPGAVLRAACEPAVATRHVAQAAFIDTIHTTLQRAVDAHQHRLLAIHPIHAAATSAMVAHVARMRAAEAGWEARVSAAHDLAHAAVDGGEADLSACVDELRHAPTTAAIPALLTTARAFLDTIAAAHRKEHDAVQAVISTYPDAIRVVLNVSSRRPG